MTTEKDQENAEKEEIKADKKSKKKEKEETKEIKPKKGEIKPKKGEIKDYEDDKVDIITQMSQDARNIMKGVLLTLAYITLTIIIPYITFSWVRSLDIFGLITIEMTQTQYERIIFWVVAFGLIISGCAFFSFSSPSQSIRGGVFALIQVILNCFYIWSYKFSGAAEIQFDIVDMGFFYLNLQQMIMMYLGIYLFLILLKVYDIVDFIVNRDKIREIRLNKIRENKRKKAIKKEEKELKELKKEDKEVLKE
jgi:hypothetical protein